MKKKITKTQQQKNIRKLQRKCLRLWKKAVKLRAGNKCEKCGSSKFLNACHIESYETNHNLRYDLRNGVSFCPRHHKWGKESLHKSFIFSYLFMMTEKRFGDLEYLLKHHQDKRKKVTEKVLLTKISSLENFIKLF